MKGKGIEDLPNSSSVSAASLINFTSFRTPFRGLSCSAFTAKDAGPVPLVPRPLGGWLWLELLLLLESNNNDWNDALGPPMYDPAACCGLEDGVSSSPNVIRFRLLCPANDGSLLTADPNRPRLIALCVLLRKRFRAAGKADLLSTKRLKSGTLATALLSPNPPTSKGRQFISIGTFKSYKVDYSLTRRKKRLDVAH